MRKGLPSTSTLVYQWKSYAFGFTFELVLWDSWLFHFCCIVICPDACFPICPVGFVIKAFGAAGSYVRGFRQTSL